MWPWPLTFWPLNLISSYLHQWQKCGENPSIDTGDIAETYSLGRTDKQTQGLKLGQTWAKHIASGTHSRQRLKNKLFNWIEAYSHTAHESTADMLYVYCYRTNKMMQRQIMKKDKKITRMLPMTTKQLQQQTEESWSMKLMKTTETCLTYWLIESCQLKIPVFLLSASYNIIVIKIIH